MINTKVYKWFKRNEEEKFLLMRSDRRIEWQCDHGIGHTLYAPLNSDFIHGCDGCCRTKTYKDLRNEIVELEKKKKDLNLDQLHKLNKKCVFCLKSSKKARGGYFKNKFICETCNMEIKKIDSYLWRD